MIHSFFAFQFHYYPPCDKFHVTSRSGKVYILTAKHYRRTSRTHMHRLSSVFVKKINCSLELGTSYYAVVYKQQLFVPDKLCDRHQLHFGNMTSTKRRFLSLISSSTGICFICATLALSDCFEDVKLLDQVGVYFI